MPGLNCTIDQQNIITKYTETSFDHRLNLKCRSNSIQIENKTKQKKNHQIDDADYWPLKNGKHLN